MYILETDGDGDSGDFDDDMHIKHGPCFGIWHSFISAFGAAPSFSPPSRWPSRWLMLGYAFFTMVFVASYTANMTNFLISTKPPVSMKSMDEVIEQDKTACIWEGGTKKKMRQLFKEAQDKHLREDNDMMGSWEFDSKNESAECHALITADADAQYFIGSPVDGVKKHCNKQLVGEPLLPINVVWMINPNLPGVADALSWYISQLQAEVYTEKLRKDWFAAETCTDSEKDAAVDAAAKLALQEDEAEDGKCSEKADPNAPQSLGPAELAGLFIVMGFFVITTLIGLVVRKLCAKKGAADEEQIEDDNPMETVMEQVLEKRQAKEAKVGMEPEKGTSQEPVPSFCNELKNLVDRQQKLLELQQMTVDVGIIKVVQLSDKVSKSISSLELMGQGTGQEATMQLPKVPGE